MLKYANFTPKKQRDVLRQSKFYFGTKYAKVHRFIQISDKTPSIVLLLINRMEGG
jgi:hypothetical protein